MSEERKETCANCRFWDSEKEDDGGHCHRYPPLLVEGPIPSLKDGTVYDVGYWPRTDCDDWCGEWQQAKPDDGPGVVEVGREE